MNTKFPARSIRAFLVLILLISSITSGLSFGGSFQKTNLTIAANLSFSSSAVKIDDQVKTENTLIDSFQKLSANDFEGEGDLIISSLILEDPFIMKGENALFSLRIKNSASSSVQNVSVVIVLESIPSDYGPSYSRDNDRDGTYESLELEAKIDLISESLDPQEEVENDVAIGPVSTAENKHGIIPLNRGSWKVSRIILQGESVSDCTYTLLKDVLIRVTFNPYEHITFAYYVNDDIPEFSNGKNMRDSIQEAIDRLANDYPFSIKILVIEEDNSWLTNESLLSGDDLINSAWVHVGTKLGLKDNVWDYVPDYDLYKKIWTETKETNAGFDILLAITKRASNGVGGLAGYAGNWALVTGGRLDLLNYRIPEHSFDNLIQHELSHNFAADDRDYSNTIMDTAPIFDGENFTSPCLELTNYTQEDIDHMCKHAERFDGKPNPVSSQTWGEERTLISDQFFQWASPKIALPLNSSSSSLHLLSVRQPMGGGGINVLYYRMLINGFWSRAIPITSSAKNSTNPDITVDLEENFHVVWIDRINGSFGGLFYRMKNFNGNWEESLLLENYTDCSTSKTAADTSGRIHLIYESRNDSSSMIYYMLKENNSWSEPIPLPGSSNNSHSPNISADLEGNVHFTWVELDVVSETNSLYYNYWNNESNFSSKEQLWQEASNVLLTTPQITTSNNGTIKHFLWRALSEASSNSSLWYCEKLANGTITNPTAISATGYDKKVGTSTIAVNNEGRVYVLWENLHPTGNRSYLLYRVKTLQGHWSLINRISPLSENYFSPSLVFDSSGNLQFVYCTNKTFSAESITLSKMYHREIYSKFFVIIVSDFYFNKVGSSYHSGIYARISGVKAISNCSEVGVLNNRLETPFHRFGIWRRGEGFPVFDSTLALDTNIGTWFSGTINMSSLKPGEYIAIVAFKDSTNTYSGHWIANNSIIIEDNSDSNSNEQNSKWLIIGLAVGISSFVLVVILPFSIILLKKRQRKTIADK